MPPIKLLSIAAGSRGTGYATYANQHPDRAQIIGVAESRALRVSDVSQKSVLDLRDSLARPDAVARAQAVLSLALWLGVISAGRLIAYV